MRRILIDRPGGYVALRLVEFPDADPGQPGASPAAGEVEVEVEAIADLLEAAAEKVRQA